MKLSRWTKVFGVLALAGSMAALTGCKDQPVDDESTEVGASELAAEHERGEHHDKHARGPAMLLGAALRELDLTDAQRATIQAEMDALKAGAEERRGDHEAARKVLAEAVKSGKVDEAALLAQMPKPAFDHARVAKAIGVLHATLTAPQRKQLVDTLLAKVDKLHGPDGEHARGERGERGERGARGPRPDGKHAFGDKGRGMHGPGMRGPLGHLLRGIELSDAQREHVHEAMSKLAPSDADREQMKAKHEAFRAAMRERLQKFAADRFDESAFATPPEGAPGFGPKAMHDRMVKVLTAIVPILDETQRAELAKRIEEGPDHAR